MLSAIVGRVECAMCMLVSPCLFIQVNVSEFGVEWGPMHARCFYCFDPRLWDSKISRDRDARPVARLVLGGRKKLKMLQHNYPGDYSLAPFGGVYEEFMNQQLGPLNHDDDYDDDDHDDDYAYEFEDE